MATTIKSTSLDFNSIKNNLKSFFAAQDEFADYDFEASGLSNILDVLAYNTHYNALTANFALNESFLGTAQLRSSIISLATAIGYIPDSRISSRATVTLQINYSGSPKPDTITMPKNTKFTTSIDDTTYTFQTREELSATESDTTAGLYTFVTAGGTSAVRIYEGAQKTKTFIVGPYEENTTYVIPDKNLDITSAEVKVYDSPSSSNYVTYTNITDATQLKSSSTIYILKEAPNGFYELTFGDGNALGITPTAGKQIVVDYLSTKGESANGASVFTPTAQLEGQTITVSVPSSETSIKSISGAEKESIESIRKNAPFLYASQNRMVTAADYSALILRKYSQYIDDLSSWGGEENLEPEYGTTFVSVQYKSTTGDADKTTVQDGIINLVKDLGVISFNIKFKDPIVTFIELDTFFQFNPLLTSVSENSTKTLCTQAITDYFEDTVLFNTTTKTGKFGRSFRRSNLLTDIDAVSPAVLSSRCDVRMQQRLAQNQASEDVTTAGYLVLGTARTYNLQYPAAIAQADDKNYIVTSNSFTYNGITSQIRNRLNSNVLQVVNAADLTVIVSDIGSFDASAGSVTLTGFAPTDTGGNTYLKISVVPANQSAVAPVRNNVIGYDDARSSIRTTVTSATT